MSPFRYADVPVHICLLPLAFIVIQQDAYHHNQKSGHSNSLKHGYFHRNRCHLYATPPLISLKNRENESMQLSETGIGQPLVHNLQRYHIDPIS